MLNKKFTITGQVCGGKNNIGITRSGLRFPNAKFAAYKIDALRQLRAQLEGETVFPLKTKSYQYVFDYTPQDNRRRDATAILDGIFHVLEHTTPPIVSDDKLIKNFLFVERDSSKKDAKMVIVIWEK